MRLLTVGDSFTHGEELSDLNNAWPSLLAKRLGYEVTNAAKPGSGNTGMVRYVIEKAENFDLIIIAWSHFARSEWADQVGSFDIWPGCSKLPYSVVSPWRKQLIDYITDHYNDDCLYRQYLINIILLQNYLKMNNKKYLMLDSFGNHQTNNRTATVNQIFINQIDKTHYMGWPNESMMEWAYGCPIGKRGHFLDQGHEMVADKVYNYMKGLGWDV